MATVATKPMTAAEFFDWVHLPENRDRCFELERGEIVEMPLAGKYHGFVCANICRILGNFAAHCRQGYVCANDSGIIVERDPDTVRGADVCYYEDSQTADDMERKYSVEPPILAVEVMSPNDRINRTIRRVTQMLNMGVKQVWVVDPQARDVSIYRPGRDPEILTADQELVASEILSGFRCLVSDLFNVPA
jgi:Uma2 family endonuclease